MFSVGTDGGVNANTESYIAYLWRQKQGFSKFGKYTGNNNADGPFVYTGFKPAFVFLRNSKYLHIFLVVFKNCGPHF